MGHATTEEAAAAAVAAIFALYFVGMLANFKFTKFRIYLLSGLSCLFRTIGYSFRAAFFSEMSSGPPNGDYSAVSIVFNMAGFGISIAVLVLCMGVWYKNAASASKPPCWNSQKASILIRLLIAPIIIFGPITGVCIVTLRYGFPTPSHLSTSDKLREAAAWGMFSCVCILLTSAIIGLFFAQKSLSSQGKNTAAASVEDSLVGVLVICIGLLTWSCIFNVISFYHPQYSLNPNLYYPLILLPQVVELAIIVFPKFLPRICLGSRYEEWVEEQNGGNGDGMKTDDSLDKTEKGSNASQMQ